LLEGASKNGIFFQEFWGDFRLASVEWARIRAFQGSQAKAFEELVCQLTAGYDVPQGSKFTRLDLQDGGTEGFWTLPNGDIWGVQTKFVLDRADKGLFSQINASVESALKNRSRLKRYTICLPFNMHDPGETSNTETFSTRWKNAKVKWETSATNRGMDVDFDFLGEFEIFNQLRQPRAQGILTFFFSVEGFTPQWFHQRFISSKAKLERNIKLKLDLETDTDQLLQFLVAGADAQTMMKNLVVSLLSDVRKSRISEDAVSAASLYEPFANACADLVDMIEDLSIRTTFETLGSAVRNALDSALFYGRAFADVRNAELRSGLVPSKLSYQKHFFDQATSKLFSLNSVCVGAYGRLVASRVLFLLGESGSGKTHSLLKFAQRRIDQEAPCILVGGRDFTDKRPFWTQFFEGIGREFSDPHLFLGTLNSCAEAQHSRALIAIDAINESDDPSFWNRELPAIVADIQQYRHVALVASVRDSYADLCLPTGEQTALSPVRYSHPGFAGIEHLAVRKYFDAYGIAPTYIALHQEFSNPLFLLLLCEGLRNENLKSLPLGLHGLSKVLTFYLMSIESKLSSKDRLDVPIGSKLVHRGLAKFAAALFKEGRTRSSQSNANALLQQIFPESRLSKGLLQALIEEGILLSEPPSYGELEPSIRFAYQRLADYFTAEHIFECCKTDNASDWGKSVLHSTLLQSFLADSSTINRHAGLLEMLTLRLGEEFGVELLDEFTALENSPDAKRVVIRTLPWRTRLGSSGSLPRFVSYLADKELQQFSELGQLMFESLLGIAMIPTNPLNATFTHQFLLRCNLVQRDLSWTCYAVESWDERRSVFSLLHSLNASQDDSLLPALSSDSVALACTVLGWICTVPDRELRDLSTKTIVKLLTNRLALVVPLLQQFELCDDPYIHERLLAAVYGACARSDESQPFNELCSFLRSSKFPANILLQDYIRQIMAIATKYRIPGCDGKLNFSTDPLKLADVQTASKLSALYGHGGSNDSALLRSLWYNLCEGEDFGRTYVAPPLQQWSRTRIGRSREEVLGESLSRFHQKLTPEQRKAVEIETQRRSDWQFFLASLAGGEDPQTQFIEIMGPSLASEFWTLQAALSDGDVPLDHHVLLRWIFERVVSLVSDKPAFASEYDPRLHYYPSRPRCESLIAKYVWSAQRELLAKLSTELLLLSERFHNQGEYLGPWQLGIRDLDPTLGVLRSAEFANATQRSQWWHPSICDLFKIQEDAEWLADDAEFVQTESSLIRIASEDKTSWFALESDWQSIHVVGYQPDTSIGEKSTDNGYRKIWMDLHSYLVRDAEAGTVVGWLSEQDLWGDWMPKVARPSNIFLLEIPDGVSFQGQIEPYYLFDGWTSPANSKGKSPGQIHQTTFRYHWSADDDLSLGTNLDILLPQPILMQGLACADLRKLGECVDPNGTAVFFDPGALFSEQNCLLGREDKLRDFLALQQLSLVWIVIGEKLVATNSWTFSPTRHRYTAIWSLIGGQFGVMRTTKIVKPELST
jgi:hypothetical protein